MLGWEVGRWFFGRRWKLCSPPIDISSMKYLHLLIYHLWNIITYLSIITYWWLIYQFQNIITYIDVSISKYHHLVKYQLWISLWMMLQKNLWNWCLPILKLDSSFTHFQASNCAQIRTRSRSLLEINVEKALAPRPWFRILHSIVF